MLSHQVHFEGEILPNSTVVYVISKQNTESGLQAGPKLGAQIQALLNKGCVVSILVADSLQEHNSLSEDPRVRSEEALRWGDQFIRENKEHFQDCPVLRWKQFITDRQDKFNEMQARIKTEMESDETLSNVMDLTFNFINAAKGKDKATTQKLREKSHDYQKEEYAVILTMSNVFDILVYPKLSSGMSFMVAPTRFSDIEGRPRLIIVNPPTPATPRSSLFYKNLQQQKPISPEHCAALYRLNLLFTSATVSEKDKTILMIELATLVMFHTTDNKKARLIDRLQKQMAILPVDLAKFSERSKAQISAFSTILQTIRSPISKEAILESIGNLLDIRVNGPEKIKMLSGIPSLTLTTDALEESKSLAVESPRRRVS